MGQDFSNFSFGNASDPLMIVILVIFAALAIYIGYKSVLYYLERRKWMWFIQLCKERRMSPKEVAYLKNIIVRRKITSVDDLFGSIYSLNLPTPIKRKLLWDEKPTGARAR